MVITLKLTHEDVTNISNGGTGICTQADAIERKEVMTRFVWASHSVLRSLISNLCLLCGYRGLSSIWYRFVVFISFI